jgi:hypothetical protein
MLDDKEPDMEAPKRSRFRVFMTLEAQHSDGSKTFIDRVAPFSERPSERMVRTLLTGFFQTPIHECSTPSGFVPGTTPVTEIQCSLQIVENTSIMPSPSDLANPQLTFSDLEPEWDNVT